MTAINCKEIARKCHEEIKETIEKNNLRPSLAVFTIGNDDASKVYVNNKIKTAKELGINCIHLIYDKYESEKDIVKKMKTDASLFDGVILQLPIPKKFNAERIINNCISPLRDSDGLTYENQAKLLVNSQEFYLAPCTAKGIVKILENITILEGKNVLIINRSLLIGKPLAALLTNKNATVTLCHSKSDIQKYKDLADIVVTGIGTPHYFKASDFPNAKIIIDASMNRDENGKLCGDVIQDKEDVLYTPVPGGVGPMTVVMLMSNVVDAALYKREQQHD